MPTPEQYKEQRDALQERARVWLTEHWPEHDPCPICKNPDFDIGTIIEVPIRILGPDDPLAGRVYPLIVATCNRCGYTIFFNALRAGLLDSDSEPEPATQQESPSPAVGQ